MCYWVTQSPRPSLIPSLIVCKLLVSRWGCSLDCAASPFLHGWLQDSDAIVMAVWEKKKSSLFALAYYRIKLVGCKSAYLISLGYICLWCSCFLEKSCLFLLMSSRVPVWKWHFHFLCLLDWVVWCPCLIIIHRHLSVSPGLHHRNTSLSWPQEQYVSFPTTNTLRAHSPQTHIPNTCYYHRLKLIEVFCEIPMMLWHYFTYCLLFRLKCEFWRLRL